MIRREANRKNRKGNPFRGLKDQAKRVIAYVLCFSIVLSNLPGSLLIAGAETDSTIMITAGAEAVEAAEDEIIEEAAEEEETYVEIYSMTLDSLFDAAEDAIRYGDPMIGEEYLFAGDDADLFDTGDGLIFEANPETEGEDSLTLKTFVKLGKSDLEKYSKLPEGDEEYEDLDLSSYNVTGNEEIIFLLINDTDEEVSARIRVVTSDPDDTETEDEDEENEDESEDATEDDDAVDDVEEEDDEDGKENDDEDVVIYETSIITIPANHDDEIVYSDFIVAEDEDPAPLEYIAVDEKEENAGIASLSTESGSNAEKETASRETRAAIRLAESSSNATVKAVEVAESASNAIKINTYSDDATPMKGTWYGSLTVDGMKAAAFVTTLSKLGIDYGLMTLSDSNLSIVSALAVTSITDGTDPFDTEEGTGNDTSAENRIVRSFDYVNYSLGYTTDLKDSSVGSVDDAYMMIEFTLPMDPSEAVFNMNQMTWCQDYVTTYYYEDGTSSTTWDTDKTVTNQVLTGKRYISSQSGHVIPGSGSLTTGIYVKAASNNTEIQPTFTVYMEGNDAANEAKTIKPDAVTVSAAPKYNIRLYRNTLCDSLGYFDLTTGEMASTNSFNGTDEIVYGRIEGYGITVQLYNDSANKGLKGVELPSGDITFDIELTTTFSGTDMTETDGYHPLLWDYEEATADSSRKRGKLNRNMVAFGAVKTSYAYLTPGNNKEGQTQTDRYCYDGGTWNVTQKDDYSLSVTIDGDYLFDVEDFIFPTYGLGDTATSARFGANIGCFSSGYIEVIAAFPENVASDIEQFQFTVEVKDMEVASASGEKVTEERTYSDNTASDALNIKASGGSVTKYNWYRKENRSTLDNDGSSQTGSGYGYRGETIQIASEIKYDGDTPLSGYNFLQKFDDKALEVVPTDETGYSYNTNVNSNSTLDSITVLYAAKPDGSGWSSDEEMKEAKEENLIYFTSLDALKDAKFTCVGFLYEIRGSFYVMTGSGNYTYMKMKVLDTAEIGKVYQTVNTLRAWQAAFGEAPTWKDVTFDGVSGAYGWGNTSWTTGNDYHDGYTAPTFTASREENYSKTVYNNGVRSGHTNGNQAGDSLLIIGDKTSVSIAVADTDTETQTAKTVYDLDIGERKVTYTVTPEISPAGTNQSIDESNDTDNITLTITLPKGLNYDYGSATKLPGSVTENNDGTTTIIWTYSDVPIQTGAPENFTFTCTIGAAATVDDVKNNDTLTVTAKITSDQDERINNTTNKNISETTISVIRLGASSISKTTESDYTELGEEITFHLHYENSSSNVQEKDELLDILPYSGDGRGSNFTGSYKVSKVTVDMSEATKTWEKDQADQNNHTVYIEYTPDDTIRGYTQEQIEELLKEEVEGKDDEDDDENGEVEGEDDENDDENEENDELSGLGFTILTESEGAVDFQNQTVTWDFSDNNITGVTALYIRLDEIYGNECVTVSITLSMSDDNGLFKDKDDLVQQPGDIYANDFYQYYKNEAGVVTSDIVTCTVVEREISGVVWVDENRNGVYDDGEKPFEGATVTLYSTKTPDYGTSQADSGIVQGVDLYPAFDVQGNEVEPVVTDADGAYAFHLLEGGTYYVVVTGSDSAPISDYGLTEKNATRVGDTVNSDAAASVNDGKLENAYIVSTLPSISAQTASSEYKSKNNDAGLVLAPFYLEKVSAAADEDTKLAGAVFTLTDSGGNYLLFDDNGVYTGTMAATAAPDTAKLTTGSNGRISVSGLPVGLKATLTETEAPKGYKLDGSESWDIEVRIDEQSDSWLSYSYVESTKTDEGNPLVVINWPIIDIEGTKEWDDAYDQDGIRPEYIDVYLLADGERVRDNDGNYISAHVTPDADGNWTFRFTDLNKCHEDGTEIIYSIEEIPVSGYETEISDFTITNTHEPETTAITVTKEWESKGSNPPTSIEVQLMADGSAYGKAVTLNQSEDWTYTWKGLPVNSNGKKIEYTVSELNVPDGYTAADGNLTSDDNGNYSVTIENSYSASGEVTLSATKTINGMESTVRTFNFELYEADGNFDQKGQTVYTGSIGSESSPLREGLPQTIEFPTLNYTEAGTYYYVIRETSTGTAGDGWTYDGKEYHVTVEMEDTGNGSLDPTVTYSYVDENGATQTAESADFTNSYKAAATSVQFAGTKYISNSTETDKEFAFELYETADGSFNSAGVTPKVVSTSGSIDAHGQHFDFDEITYDKAGTHYYVMQEHEDNEANGWTNSKTVYYITVDVIDNLAGKLKATVSYVKEIGGEPHAVAGSEDDVYGVFEFTNTYAATGGVELTAVKELEGRAASGKTFTFALYESDEDFTEPSDDSRPIEILSTSGTIDASQQVSFEEIEYEYDSSKTYPMYYHYIIREITTDESGWTCDTGEYHVTVTVTDDSSGTLITTTTTSPNYVYVDADGGKHTAENAVFTNTYAATGILNLSGTKTLEGGTIADGQFTYSVWEGETKAATGTVSPDGKITFTQIDYTYSDIGEHIYTITEDIGSDESVRYDSTSYTVAVTVTDDETGDLAVSYTVNGEENGSVDFTNYQKGSLNITKTFSGLTDEQIEELTDFTITVESSDRETEAALTLDDGTKGPDGTYTWKVSDLPAGTYTVTEAGYSLDGYEVIARSGETEVTDGSEVSVEDNLAWGGEETVAFINDYTEVGSIEITKYVIAEENIQEAHRDTEYTVAVIAEDDVNFGWVTATSSNGREVTPTPGGKTITFTIKENETVTIDGLPAGRYKVEEQGSDAVTSEHYNAFYHVNGYETESAPTVKVISGRDSVVSVEIDNEYPIATYIMIQKEYNKDTYPDEGFTFIIEALSCELDSEDSTLDTDEMPMPENHSVTLTGSSSQNDHAVNLGYIEYDYLGTYYYMITEVSNDAERNIDYDTSVHYIKVVVASSEDTHVETTDEWEAKVDKKTENYKDPEYYKNLNYIEAEEGIVTSVFSNTAYEELTIEKEVSGSSDITEYEFEVILTADGEKYDGGIVSEPGSETVEFTDGKATLTVQPGEMITLLIPSGSDCTINEKTTGADTTTVYDKDGNVTVQAKGKTTEALVTVDKIDDASLVRFVNSYRSFFTIDEEIIVDQEGDLFNDDNRVRNESVNAYNAIEIEMTTNLPVVTPYDLETGEFTMNFHEKLDSALKLDEQDSDFSVYIAGEQIPHEYYVITYADTASPANIRPFSSYENAPITDGCNFHVDIDLTALYNGGIITDDMLDGNTEIAVFFFADLEGTDLNGSYKSTVWYEIYDGYDEETRELLYRSEESYVEIYTYEIDIIKYATDRLNDENYEEAALQGAEFGVYYDEGCEEPVYRYIGKGFDESEKQAYTAVSGEDGYAVFNGLAEGTYYLKELAAPEGYVLSGGVIEVRIGADTDSTSGNNITVGNEPESDEEPKSDPEPHSEPEPPNPDTPPDGDGGSPKGGSSGNSTSHGSGSFSGNVRNVNTGKTGHWILEGALFTLPDGSHPSNEYLEINGVIWAFYTNGYAVNKGHTQYYTDEAIAAAGNIPTATGTWDVIGWWFKYDDGTYPHDEWVLLEYNGITYRYHFDVDGWMDDGWFTENDITYYLDPVFDGWRGHMLTGWQEIGGYWYYFRNNGSLFKNGTTPDGYTVDANGRWIG